MKNYNWFFDNFNELGISLIATTYSDYNMEFDFFLNFLQREKYVIDEDCDNVIDELSKVKNRKVFVLQPTNDFIFDKDENLEHWEYKKKFYEKIHSISVSNNLSIILLTYTYNTNKDQITNIDHKLSLVSNYIINYKNKKIKIIKNRYGGNDEFEINELRPYWLVEEREVKLKRIIKNKKKQLILKS